MPEFFFLEKACLNHFSIFPVMVWTAIFNVSCVFRQSVTKAIPTLALCLKTTENKTESVRIKTRLTHRGNHKKKSLHRMYVSPFPVKDNKKKHKHTCLPRERQAVFCDVWWASRYRHQEYSRNLPRETAHSPSALHPSLCPLTRNKSRVNSRRLCFFFIFHVFPANYGTNPSYPYGGRIIYI